MHKLAVDLGPVQETLLIPLLGRAEATQAQGGLLHDPKAVEIVQALDYDFDKWRGGPSLLGTVLRTRLFDEQVKTFLAQHPRGTVVEIGGEAMDAPGYDLLGLVCGSEGQLGIMTEAIVRILPAAALT